MELIGKYLKNIRESKGYTISKVSKELNISLGILEEIENDSFPNYLSTVYLVGHIRSYSKFLELDEKEIIKNFKIQASYNLDESKKEISKPVKKNDFSNFPKMISIGSVFAISFIFYLFFIQPSNIKNNFAITPDVPENMSSNLEEIEMEVVLQNNSNKIFDKQKNDINFNMQKQNIHSSSAIASLPDKNLDSDLKKITLKFNNPTWIQLRNKDDKIILSKLMNQGDEYTYNAQEKLNLTAGNAGNIIVSFDGVVKGKAGKAGEVIDSLIVEKFFKN